MAVNTVILIFLVYSLYSFRTLSILFCVINGGESEVAQSCPTLSDPMDCSLLGLSVHGIFQVRVLEWGAVACLFIHTVSLKLLFCILGT